MGHWVGKVMELVLAGLWAAVLCHVLHIPPITSITTTSSTGTNQTRRTNTNGSNETAPA